MPTPPSGHVEIAVEAAGLNFSDVLKSMGLYPGITDKIVPLGIECAGVVTRVGAEVRDYREGDRVFGVAPLSFASHTIAPDYMLARTPETISSQEAATIPITFMTAWYALVQLADLQPGERVLIHAAAGGVGVAAIQIANAIGAEIFATAGSDQKREYVRSHGVKHVFNSRTLEFAEQIFDITSGKGVDVVLNSLPGEAIDRSIACLSAYGRFLEIGKVDIYQNHRIGLLPFQDNLSYHAIDLDRVLRQRPALVKRLFQGVLAGFESGAYQALPRTDFAISDVRDAFRYMAQRKNIGKVVVSNPCSSNAEDASSGTEVSAVRKQTQLITGGLGAIGLQLAEWLSKSGETHLALLSRRAPGDEAKQRIEQLRARGISLAIIAGDVSDWESLKAAIESLPTDFPAIGGVWHAAGVLADGLLARMVKDQFAKPLVPKLQGTLNLHRLMTEVVAKHPQAVPDAEQRFVLFSSIACLLGSPGQSNYAAANAFLDSFAHFRHGLGLPATVVNWGPWAEGGMAVEAGRDQQLGGRGLALLPADASLELLGNTVHSKVTQLAVLDADWSTMLGGRGGSGTLPSLLREVAAESGNVQADSDDKVDQAFRDSLLAAKDDDRIELLRDYFAKQLGLIMGLAADQLDPSQSLGAMGLDSLMAIELKNTIEARIGVVLPMARFMEGPSLQDLASQVSVLLTDGQDVAKVSSASSQQVTTDTQPQRQPLSQGQLALWFIHQLSPDATAYNISDAVFVDGPLRVDALRHAIDTVVSRHDALRTTFHSDGGRPFAMVAPSIDAPLQVVDASGWDDERLRSEATTVSNQPFDLQQGPLIRVVLFRQAEDRHVLFFSVHHIIADFWSLVHCTHQFRETYTALIHGEQPNLSPRTHQYGDFVDWQTRMLETPEGLRQKDYWAELLAGELPVLELPTDRPRPAEQTFSGRIAFRWLNTDLTDKLKRFAKDREMTLNMILLAGYQLLLHRLSGQNDVLIGMPTSGRSRSEFADVAGYFVNPVLSRSKLEADTSVETFLKQTRQSMLGALENQDYPLPMLVDLLKPPRDPSRSTLFQAMFVMQKAQIMHDEGMTPFLMGQTGAKLEVADLVFSSMTLDQWTSQFDISLAASEADGGVSLGLQYNTDLFGADTADTMLRRYEKLLETLIERPAGAGTDERLASVGCLIDEEYQRVTADWAMAAELPGDLEPVLAQFETQVEKTPDAIALVSNGTSAAGRAASSVIQTDNTWTYRQLNDRANVIAAELLKHRVGRGDRVGLSLPRSPELIAAMLATWKVGAAYVPMDPNYPPARLRRMIETSGIRAVVVIGVDSTSKYETDLPILLAEQLAEVAAPANNVGTEPSLDDVAYVIFTSGSTGLPKGAAVYQRGFANLVRWYLYELEWSEADRVLVVTSHGFDLTQKNLFAPLLVGAQLHLASDEAFDPAVIGGQIESGAVTVLNCTPSNLYPVVAHGANLTDQRLGTLRWVVLGGEPIDRARLGHWQQQTWCRAKVMNSYGPTECSDVVAFHVLDPASDDPAKPIPVGGPVAGCRLYILDDTLQPVPPGVVGQLYVGGICVGAGYINDAVLTLKKFVDDSIAADGARMYATGDLCRWNDAGLVEFVGRVDHQVKIRGYRIELGELEATLSDLDSVDQAVAIVRQDAPNQPRLVAYVTLKPQQQATAEQIIATLREQLPSQLIPSALMILDRIPLSPHGKVDRNALPAPDHRDTIGSGGYVEPVGELETRFAQVWSQLLKVEKVGATDNFFTLGGDSLLAIQLVSKLSDQGYSCRPADLLRRQTVRELANWIQQQDRKSEQPIISTNQPATEVPLLPAQTNWVRSYPELPGHDHLQLVIRLPEQVDVPRFEAAVEKVINRHQALRLKLENRDGQWLQSFPQCGPSSIMLVVQVADAERSAERVIEEALQTWHHATDVRAGSAAKFFLFRQPNTNSPSDGNSSSSGDAAAINGDWLAISAHHLAIDPVSLQIVAEDLLLAYQFGQLPESKATDYAMLAESLREHASSETCLATADRWLQTAAQEIPLPSFFANTTTDHSSDDLVRQAKTLETVVENIARPISDVPTSMWANASQLLAALGIAYRQWCGLDWLRVDIERTGRDLEIPGIIAGRTVGWLVSMFPFDIHVGSNSDVDSSELTTSILNELDQVQNEGHSFELLREYGPESIRARLLDSQPPLIRFNYLGTIADDEELPIEVQHQLSGNSRAENIHRQHAIELDIEKIGTGLKVRWTYNANKIPSEQIESLAAAYAQELGRRKTTR